MYTCDMSNESQYSHLSRSVPANVQEALEAIWVGSKAGTFESDVLEFKEDPARRKEPHARSGNARAALVEKLIDEAVCMANGDAAGGHIVVGVSDKTAGPEGFTGTDFRPEEIESSIFKGTKPNLRVEATDFEFEGQRLLMIRIPEALTLYTRKQGQAKKRVGAKCEPLSEEERRAIVTARANPDYSNGVSGRDVEEVDLETLNEVRRLLREKHHRAGEEIAVPTTTMGLLRDLGLVTETGRLKRAGELLLLPVEPPLVSIRYLWRPISGADPQVTEIRAPLILALPQLRRLISEHSEQEIERVAFDDGQEVAVPRFPLTAIDEVITNAVVHRDWQVSRPIVVDQSPRILKVWSPGPLPPGVEPDKLLTTQSIPRNIRLMAALRMLGLAEESSRGFDRMWSAMINTGREVPEVNAAPGFVEVVMAAGKPDVAFMQALHRLTDKFSRPIIGSINTKIVLWHLWHAPLITLKQVMNLTQVSSLEANELMDDLAESGIVDQVSDAKEWVLSAPARQLMGKGDSSDFSTVTVQERIEERLKAGEALRSAELAEEVGLDRAEVTQILRHLRTLKRAIIDPSGPSRGANTRWIAP